MGTSLGEAVLSLTTDQSKFKSGLDDAKSHAQKTTGLIGGIFEGLGKVGLAGMGIKALADGVTGLASSLVSGNAEFERYETQFGVLLGSTTEAKDRLAELAEFGAKTPFELPELVRADKVLTSFGLDAKDTFDRFKVSAAQIRETIGDVAAGTGVRFEELALTFGKFASGATGEAISRFQELGIATREQMASWGLQFSKSGELLTPAKEAFSVLEKHVRDKFGGMMNAQSKTFEGMLSNLSDWWGQTQRKLMAPLFEVLKDKLQGVLDFLGSDAVAGALEGFATMLSSGIGSAVDFLGSAFGTLQGIIGPVIGEIAFYANAIWQAVQGNESFGAVLGDVGDVLDGLIGLFQGAEGAGLDLHNALERIVGLDVANFFVGIVQGAQRLTSAIPSLDEVTQRLNGAMRDLGPTGERLGRLFETIKGAIVALIPQPLLDLVSGFGEIASKADTNIDVLGTLVNVVNTVSATIESATQFISDHKEVQAALVGILTAAATAWTVMKVAALAHTAIVAAQTAATGLLTAAQTALNLAMSLNPIGIVVVALAGLVAALVYAYNTSEDFRRIVDGALAAVSQAFTDLMAVALPVLTWLNETFSGGVLTGLINLGINAGIEARKIGEGIVNGIKGGIAGMWQSFLDWVQDKINLIPKAVRDVLGIASPSKVMFEIGKNMMQGLIDGVANRSTKLIDDIRATIGDSIKLVESLMGRLEGGMSGSVLGRGADAIKGLLKGISDSDIMFKFGGLPILRNQFAKGAEDAQIVQQIKDTVAAMREMGMTIDQGVIQELKNLGENLGGPFKDQLDRFLGSLSDQDALADLKKMLGEADLARQIQSTASMLQAMGQKMPDSLRAMLEKLPRDAGGILDTVIKALLANTWGYARGTNFAPGGLALVGEYGAELVNLPRGSQVIPAQQTREMLKGGDTYFSMTVHTAATSSTVIQDFATLKALAGV